MNNVSASPKAPLVVFTLAGRLWAMPVDAVERIIQAVEVTHVPGAPDVLLGAVNIAGDTVPVLDLSRQGGSPEIALEDKMILVRIQRAHRLAALWSNDVGGLVAPAESGDAAVLDPEHLLTAEEENQLPPIFSAP